MYGCDWVKFCLTFIRTFYEHPLFLLFPEPGPRGAVSDLRTDGLFPVHSCSTECNRVRPSDSLRLASAATIKPTPRPLKKAATALSHSNEAILEDLENRWLPLYCLKSTVRLLHLSVDNTIVPSITILQLRLILEPVTVFISSCKLKMLSFRKQWTANTQDKQHSNGASCRSNPQTPSGKSTRCRWHVGFGESNEFKIQLSWHLNHRLFRFPLMQASTMTLWTCADTCQEPGSYICSHTSCMSHILWDLAFAYGIP